MAVTITILNTDPTDPINGGNWQFNTAVNAHRLRVRFSPGTCSVTVSLFGKNGWLPVPMPNFVAPDMYVFNCAGLNDGDPVSITATGWDGTDVNSDVVKRTIARRPIGPPPPAPIEYSYKYELSGALVVHRHVQEKKGTKAKRKKGK